MHNNRIDSLVWVVGVSLSYKPAGTSWSVPYLAGVYMLVIQVDLSITPERSSTLACGAGHTIEAVHKSKMFSLRKIIDPTKLIGALK
ncbi:MAG: hypothetical protein JXB07_04580 [Anaerolineae bacterium]|nr:hypothetical protein [Anaerolineae bacterium]